jgi:hypothetical protein
MKSTTRTITLVLMFVAAAGLIAWDVVVATNRTPGDTISEVTLGFFMRHPIATFAIGLVLGIILGHLTWPQFPTDPTKKA